MALRVGTWPVTIGARPRLARWLGGLEREALTIRLSLDRSATEDVVRWVGSLTGVGDADPGAAGEAVSEFGGWLAERTGGPFYIVELLRALLEEAVLALRPPSSDSSLLYSTRTAAWGTVWRYRAVYCGALSLRGYGISGLL